MPPPDGCRPRTLPLRVPLGDGEALDSWLFRLAHRNGMPFPRLVPVLGFGDRLRVWHNYALTRRLPAPLLRRIEQQTGLMPGALAAAVLDQFDPLGWTPIPGSRYCPACLSEFGGRWPIRWQLPYAFACLIHRCLLAVVCPACQRIPRGGAPRCSAVVPPHRCALGTTGGDACDGDLLTHRPRRLAVDDPRLAAQRWVSDRLDRMDGLAVSDLRDLDALAVWFRQRIEPADLTHLGQATVAALTAYRDQNQAVMRHQPTAGLLTAALTCLAVGLITAGEDDRFGRFAPLLRNVYTQHRPGTTGTRMLPSRAPMILSHKRLAGLSQPLRHKLLACADKHLPVGERLRYRTCTRKPRLPEPGCTIAAGRARHIPQYLWQDWIIRFQPLRGAHVDDLAIDLPAALLIPGNPARNIHATGELNPWRNNISIFLSEISQQYPDVLTAICAIAEYLDTAGTPIDYRRRRTTFTDVNLTWQEWEELCARADANPGRAARLLHARRYLFHLLTGADLSDRQHTLAFAHPEQRLHYLEFHRGMISPLRDQLRHHGASMLAAAGIDEPLTWSPPAECVAGLHLPGREPDDIDLAALHRLVIVDNLRPKHVAHRLGVTVAHVRYALEQLHRPPRPHASNSAPAARKIRERAARILTTEFFRREHLGAGKGVTTLMAETGFSRKILHRHARYAGVRLVSPRSWDRIKVPHARRGDRLDPDWLREQAGTLLRSNIDIAAELGVSYETIRRYRRTHGIPGRPTGGHGHVITNLRHPDLPRDIRRAVEGQRGGWQRLHRFQQMLAYPSLNSAAQALGLHTQNLNLQLQRLETDIGAQLLHRAPHRYTPMTLTPRGQRLLEDLNRPRITELLDRYADANARSKYGPYKRSDQR